MVWSLCFSLSLSLPSSLSPSLSLLPTLSLTCSPPPFFPLLLTRAHLSPSPLVPAPPPSCLRPCPNPDRRRSPLLPPLSPSSPLLPLLHLPLLRWWLLVEADVRWQLAVVRRAPVVVPVERRARVRRMELGVRVDRQWTGIVPRYMPRPRSLNIWLLPCMCLLPCFVCYI